MKTANYLFIISLFFIFACGNSNSDKKNSNNDTILKDSTEIEEGTIIPDLKKKEYSDENHFPELSKILASNQNMFLTIKQYANNIFGEINSEDKVLEILDMRTQILKDGSFFEILDEYYYSEQEDDNFIVNWDAIEKELIAMGFQGIYAEGQLVDIGIHAFMKKEIDTYLKEEDRLFLQLKEADANSKGGEYPYSGLELYSKVLEVGEELMAKFPNHKNKEEIEQIVYFALLPFVDYHEVASGMDYNEYCVGGLATEAWPWSTHINCHDYFLENYKNSKYFDIIKKIRENYSVIEIGEDGEAKPLYIVITDEFDNLQEISGKVWEYLNNGIDIPHSLVLQNKEGDYLFFVAYRFYPNKALANEALNAIIKTNKNAKIIHVSGKGKIIE